MAGKEKDTVCLRLHLLPELPLSCHNGRGVLHRHGQMKLARWRRGHVAKKKPFWSKPAIAAKKSKKRDVASLAVL
jgi:hypothetical protein